MGKVSQTMPFKAFDGAKHALMLGLGLGEKPWHGFVVEQHL